MSETGTIVALNPYLRSQLRGKLNKGEVVEWAKPNPEVPGHFFGMVTFRGESTTSRGNDAAIHVLNPGVHNSAVWITQPETIARIRVLTGIGAVTVMNLFAGDKSVRSVVLEAVSAEESDSDANKWRNEDTETVGHGDVHCYINLGMSPFIVRDEGWPAFEPGDEEVLSISGQYEELNLIKMLEDRSACS